MHKKRLDEAIYENTFTVDMHIAIGNTAFTRGDFRQSAARYREAIKAIRENITEEHLQMEYLRDRLHWQFTRQSIFIRWLESHPGGFASLPLTSPFEKGQPLTNFDNRLIKLIKVDLPKEETYLDVYDYLFEEMLRNDIPIYSPGGSMDRKIALGIMQMYDQYPIYAKDFITIPSIRLGFDLIEEEIRKRWDNP